MKTTLDIPEAIFRSAKAKAAEQGVPLRQFVTEAVAEKLAARRPLHPEERLRLAGNLRDLRKETEQINTLIEQEFEGIEPEEWA
ncbi:MAG: CopG family transcriptional regulator [Terriglobia bacterium]